MLDPSLKSLVDLNPLFVTIMVSLVILDLITLSFKLLKESKEKRNLNFLEVMLYKLNWIWWKILSFWRKFLMFLLLIYVHLRFLFFQPSFHFSWDTHSKQSFCLDEKGFLCLSLCSFGLWSNSFNFCRTIYVLNASLSCICASCISLYALFCFYWSYFTCFVFKCVQKFKNP